MAYYNTSMQGWNYTIGDLVWCEAVGVAGLQVCFLRQHDTIKDITIDRLNLHVAVL
jgi:hypothetical protein